MSKIHNFDNDLPKLDGKTILLTGGTGSFGKAFVKQIIKLYKPKKLIVFSRDELKQFEMAQEFSPEKYEFMRYFIGDIRDKDRLIMAMRGVEIVVHAAALKQVPAAEYNPFECINTNVIGAENIVQAAIHNSVNKVIALSTDKASNPVNLYGASKLASDKIFAAANHLSGDAGTCFSVVRYGNVIGSRGSVIPFFKKLIDEGVESLPITDERMTRFWITIEQGVYFVLSSIECMQGCEIFVPKIPSMKVVDVAKYVAPHMPHNVIGIRPGEKVHESLISEDESRQTFELEDRYVIGPSFSQWNKQNIKNRGGELLPEGFSYTSDKNSEWLNSDSLSQLLDETDVY